jgi:TPP-dependent pyruvate/acetoin dehydrogenase alpha subunit
MSIVGSEIPVAVGAAPGAQRSEADRICLYSFGYEASNERDLREGLNRSGRQGANRTVFSASSTCQRASETEVRSD